MFIYVVHVCVYVGINVQGTVPGGIYSDLMSAGVIQDIYYRFNDIQYRWIANETWLYSYTFQGSISFIFSVKSGRNHSGINTDHI